MKVTDPQHRLTFGSLSFVGSDGDAPYVIDVLADDTDWGNADPILKTVTSLLTDGSLVSIQHDNNREPTIRVSVTAETGVGLAEGEAALVAETRRRNTLTWTPPDTFGPPTVFEVLTSWLEHEMDEGAELDVTRHYLLHLVCHPHARSATTTTVEASGSGVTPPAPTTVQINDASSLTGWAAINYGDAPAALGTLSGETYVYTSDDQDKPMTLQYTLAAPTDYSATPNLVIDYSAPINYIPTLYAGAAGSPTELTVISNGGSPLGGSWRRIVASMGVGASSVQQIRLRVDWNGVGHKASFLWIANIAATDGNAGSGTTRQLFRSMTVGGSRPAQASIHLSHADPLGDVLVWSGPGACSPPLRQLRVSGAAATADATMVSGAREPIGTTAFTADIPLSALPPGAYAVMGRFRAGAPTGDRTITVTAQSRVAGAAVGDVVTYDVTHNFPTTTDWVIHELGVLHLPVTDSPSGADAVVRVSLLADDALELDEAWLFNVTEGTLTWLSDVPEHLWVDAPTVDMPMPRVWVGTAGDQSDAYDAGSLLNAWGNHDLEPGQWSAFTVTTGAEDAAVTATYYMRWDTHASR